LIEKQTRWSRVCAGYSDQALKSKFIAFHRIKSTQGITGLSPFRVPIDGEVRHLDVGSSHPGAESGSKGSAVRRLKRYVSWV